MRTNDDRFICLTLNGPCSTVEEAEEIEADLRSQLRKAEEREAILMEALREIKTKTTEPLTGRVLPFRYGTIHYIARQALEKVKFQHDAETSES